MMDWIGENRTWLFSGILVAVPLAIIGWLIATRSVKKTKQEQKSGSGSMNIQVGGDINLSGRKDEKK